ncbi:MAG: hypothetical protein HFJ28_06805 [Clostridia bacterium]|nr:hypothetical protein [Clostridia bacterium]
MYGYVKLKTQNKELYETDFLTKLQEKNTWVSKVQYWICYIYFEIIVRIKYVANMITVKQVYHAYIFIFPFQKDLKSKKIKKCIKKLQKLMKKYKVDTIVLSEELKTCKEFENIGIEMKKIVHILNGGKGLMPYLTKEILEYILEKQGTKTQFVDIYCLIKEQKQIYIENIAYLARFFKTMNIITPNVKYFQKIADRIEEKQEGAMITVTNNKKKSLNKAKLIINFDFSEQELKKYNVYRRAIIINMQKEQGITYAGFNGIQIENVAIDTDHKIQLLFKKNNLLENCKLEELYQSLLNEKQGFLKVKEQMQKDQVTIVKLYGKKGKIEEKEYARIA